MFPKRFQTNEVIEIVVELIYPMLFHLITPYMVLGMRKEWAFIFKGWLGFLSRGSLNKKIDKNLKLDRVIYKAPYGLKWFKPKLGFGHLIQPTYVLLN